MKDNRPWTDPATLADQLAAWRTRWAGRSLFRVTAGEMWIHLGLTGDSRPGILLTSLPGAALVLDREGPLPRPIGAALPVVRNHPLNQLLAAAEFESCGMFPGDLAAAFRFARPGEGPLYLIHQMFGARGNTVLLDDRARLLWARHRPPHSLLAAVPPRDVWVQGTPEAATDISPGALGRLTSVLLDMTLGDARGRLDRRLRTARRLVDNLSRDFASADQGDLYRRKAEALAVHLHELPAGIETVTLNDPRDGTDLDIALDPARSPAANMEAWFRKARKADKGRDVIFGRLTDARVNSQVLEDAAQGLEGMEADPAPPLERLARVQTWLAEHADLIPQKSKPGPAGRYGPEEPARPFRRYLVDGKWEVWVGRNNKENDELTHRAAHSRDIWLHAQGVSGSHVILRTGGKPETVPRPVLEKAAALAALNCKARNSELVPVIYTERRYVRKPRKAPPGTAVCLREKSLFVTPGAAPGVVSI